MSQDSHNGPNLPKMTTSYLVKKAQYNVKNGPQNVSGVDTGADGSAGSSAHLFLA